MTSFFELFHICLKSLIVLSHLNILITNSIRLIKETETPNTLKNQIGAKKLDWDDYYSLDVVSK